MKRGWHLIAGIPCLGALLAFCVPYSSAGGGQDPAPPVRRKWVCPLSDDQQQKAPKAFAAMTPTFLHPRCVNCHGVVDTSTGDFHLGGVVDPTARETRTVHRKNPKTGADEKITEQVPLCSQCHIDGWTTPDPPFFFKGKDSVRLCRQMKGTMDNADRFMGHISKDATLLVPFIQESFKGTRGLTPEGQHYYQTETNKKYETEEEKPPISHATFIAQAQAWVDAMGGKFHGDRDCGCVPHHYILSIDMKSNSDFHVADSASHTEMSIHTEIPLEFKDDGSFETEGQMSWVITGYQRMRRQNCDFNGSLDMRFKMKGRVDEDKGKLHLEFTNSSATQSVRANAAMVRAGRLRIPTPPVPRACRSTCHILSTRIMTFPCPVKIRRPSPAARNCESIKRIDARQILGGWSATRKLSRNGLERSRWRGRRFACYTPSVMPLHGLISATAVNSVSYRPRSIQIP